MDEELEAGKDRSWRKIAEIDRAHERGDLDDEGWHAAVAALVVPAYLAAKTPEGGSGSTRDRRGWKRARSLLADATARGQTFLDVGCANGLLMESMARWAGVEPYGVDISSELVDEARRRLPHWADRIWVGNAASWRPPMRFDVARSGLEYVPPPRRRDYVAHLLSFADRVVVGVFNEERDDRALERAVESWGFRVAGRVERPQPRRRLA